MNLTAVRPGVSRLFLLAAAIAAVTSVQAQPTNAEFITGSVSEAWAKWQAATKAVLTRDKKAAEDAFAEFLKTDPSAFRIALFAERTVMHTADGGAVLLLEQDLEAGTLQDAGRSVAELLVDGREQMNEADDGWYFASIGRFDVANANFRALIDSKPDPVALLEFADRVPRRQQVLIQLINNPTVGGAALEMLRLLERGEMLIKADPARIKENIDRLAGPPRGFENAVDHLKNSGEYSIPFIIQYLRNPDKGALSQALLRALPLVDRAALNPLVISLRMNDLATKRYLIRALGQIGYAQAVPYLLQLRDNNETPAEVRDAAGAALDELSKRGVKIDYPSAAEAFYKLADEYYADNRTLAADPRLDTANVWYWRDDLLQNVEVPTAIFNDIMCMRCCEEALRLNPNMKEPLALWLAANFRREAQLPAGQTDPTRSANYPSAAYFAQSAGADYCLMALARGIDFNEPAVALGAIQALRKTAGPASLVTDASGRLPLAEALSFPDRMVRVRAGLALANALPTKTFQNYQNLMPVLSEALRLSAGSRNALVVDADSESGNSAAAMLRSAGFEALTDAQLFTGLEKVRRDLAGLDLILLASDTSAPNLEEALKQLRGEFRFAGLPVVIIAKDAERGAVREMVRADHRLGEVSPGAGPELAMAEITRVSRAVGAQAITPEVGAALALESAQALRLLAETNNSLFNVAEAEPALISTLTTDDTTLRTTVAQVLGYIGTATAQEAIARIALDTAEAEEMRVKMFAALAEAAKRQGSRLGDEQIKKIVGIAEHDENLVIREAASQALGALNLPGNPASEIIRSQYNG